MTRTELQQIARDITALHSRGLGGCPYQRETLPDSTAISWDAPDFEFLDNDEDIAKAMLRRHRNDDSNEVLPPLAGASLARWQEVAQALYEWNENGGPWPLGKE